ncbi:zinc finger BED domain-containing protein RICESLEEPER 2-like [Lactuca sativa]|uniref:zinc finger BED domain-containing protein RICESLEEPER 2-like n=1 Tax=Lactuca sativa TaxID=4236 RepID=UPI000CD80715|nr:zinc finger BED domain-containing protein RICESLEEPER 2-like [Lactuca sativa]
MENGICKKRILNFEVILNRKGDTIGKMVESCLITWGIEKVFTITVDNTSFNDTVISFLKKKIQNWGHVILDAQYLRMRCCAHVLNLIVCDGLKDYYLAIQVIRNVVRYFRSSPSRLAKFKEFVKIEKLNVTGTVCLDVSTRWNSTYLMLESALKYRKTFNSLLNEVNAKKKYDVTRVGPPSDIDWDVAQAFMLRVLTFMICVYCIAILMNALKSEDWQSLEEMYPIGDIAWKKKLKATLTGIYDFYLEKDHMHARSSYSNNNHNKRKVNENLSIQEKRMLKYKAHLEDEKPGEMSKLERYSSDNQEPSYESFDLLDWWKTNEAKYKILEKITWDVLAVPVSTVALESAFSTRVEFWIHLGVVFLLKQCKRLYAHKIGLGVCLTKMQKLVTKMC